MIIKCSQCGAIFAATDKQCPSCGLNYSTIEEKNKPVGDVDYKMNKKTIIFLIVLTVIILAIWQPWKSEYDKRLSSVERSCADFDTHKDSERLTEYYFHAKAEIGKLDGIEKLKSYQIDELNEKLDECFRQALLKKRTRDDVK